MKHSRARTELKRWIRTERRWNKKEVSRRSPEGAVKRRPTSRRKSKLEAFKNREFWKWLVGKCSRFGCLSTSGPFWRKQFQQRHLLSETWHASNSQQEGWLPSYPISGVCPYAIIIIIIFRPWYFITRVWDIKQSVWCLKRLQWGLGNCESVRQADCAETLDYYYRQSAIIKQNKHKTKAKFGCLVHLVEKWTGHF